MQSPQQFFSDQKISGPQQLCEDSVWLRLYLDALSKRNVRSLSVRHLLLALRHRYRPETPEQMATFVNQVDREAATAAAAAFKVRTNPDTHPADPHAPPSEQVAAAGALIDLTKQGVEPNPGPLRRVLDAAAALFHALPSAGPVPAAGMRNPFATYRLITAEHDKADAIDRANARHAKQNAQRRRVAVRGISTATTQAVEPNPGPPKGRRGVPASAAKRLRTLLGTRPAPRRKRTRIIATAVARQATVASRAPVAARPRGQKGDMTQRNVPNVLDRTDIVLSTTVDGSSSITSGTLICRIPVNPAGDGNVSSVTPTGINAALLNYVAALWELWDANVTFIIKPTGNTFVTGTFTAGFDMDAKDNVPSLDQLIQQGGQTFTYAQGGRITYSPGNRAKAAPKYWVQPNGSDPRLYTKGVFYVLSNETPTTYGSTGATAGAKVPFQVHCHYRFSFRNPTFEPASSYGTGVAMYAFTQSPSFITYDPFAFSDFSSISANYMYCPGLVSGTAVIGGHTYGVLVFPVNTQFDNWTGVAFSLQTEDTSLTSGTFAAAFGSGGSYTIDRNVVQASARGYVGGRYVFANAPSSVSLTTGYQQSQDGTWTPLSGSALTVKYWGYMAFNGAGSSISAIATTCLCPIGAFNPSLQERQWRTCGPATTHGAFIAANPGVNHLACAYARYAASVPSYRDENDLLRQQLRALRAELRPPTPDEIKRMPDGQPAPYPTEKKQQPPPTPTVSSEADDEVEYVEAPIPPQSNRSKSRSLK